MRRKKVILALAMVALTMFGGVTAIAGTIHKVGCAGRGTSVNCPRNFTHYEYYHVLYTTPNGDVICKLTLEGGVHDIVCSNSECNALITTQYRDHAEYHQYCPDKTGLCQY